MNCDHAFDLMTDPSLDDSAELHAHLDGCPRCQQMYETLSPALGLFDTVSSGSAMSFEADDAATSVDLAQRVAVRLSQTSAASAVSARPGRSRVVWACVMAGGLGFLCAIGLTSLHSPGEATSPSARHCTWTHRDAVPTETPASAVVLSCVACHQAPREPQTSTLLWEDWTMQLAAGDLFTTASEDPLWLQRAVWPAVETAHS